MPVPVGVLSVPVLDTEPLSEETVPVLDAEGPVACEEGEPVVPVCEAEPVVPV